MSLLVQMLIGLALFARDGWFGRPARVPTVTLADLVGLAIAQIATVLVAGAAMAGLASLLAVAIKSFA